MKINRIFLFLVLCLLIISKVTCCDAFEANTFPSKYYAETLEAQQTQTQFAITASAAYAEDCDAFDQLTVEVYITEEAQYDTWSSCQYYLKVTNNSPVQSIWVWVHDIHATETGIDRDDWSSWKIEPGATEEWSYLGDFQYDGSFGHRYASEISAILAISECSVMREKTNAIKITRPVQWFCGP